ncbi:hypothetical protein [Roseomonas chloroacetimidivorans]|jgi:pyrrolidone-carboxylate peptidase|uniref:hypothetical protein n=1 Tax=Roseomonas chloroacetimidivorans TaxID=1766656 RepID=UPI003C71D0C4
MILLTGFAPFGPKGWLAGTNASQEVLNRVLAQRPKRYHGALLQVGDEGLKAFRALLASQRWSGVFAMGEGGLTSEHVILEPFANAIERPGLVPAGWFNRVEESSFALGAKAEKVGNPGSMGGYWCNRIHLEALRWARQQGGVPVAFAHIPPVLGEALPGYARRVRSLYERYTGEVFRLLDQMEQALHRR